MAAPRELDTVGVADVVVPEGRRPVRDDAVASLADSMAQIGLQTPITVRLVDGMVIDGFKTDGVPVLVTGAHRLAAARYLGWDRIDAWLVDYDDATDAELWEIDENLRRAELSPAQVAEHLKRRKALWERRQENGNTVSVSKVGKGGAGPGRGHEGFASETAAATGVTKQAVNKAVSRATALGDDIKDVAGTSLDKGVELDALAKMAPEDRRPLIDAAKAGEKITARSPDQRRQKQTEDRDLSDEAADKIAQLLAEHVPGECWDGLTANLYRCSGREIAKAFTRLTGVSVFDRTMAGAA